jgi:four helix bundle protein
MNTFKDILAWQAGYKLTLSLYKFTKNFPQEEEFGLKSELRRASVSVISNIAEGFRKYSLKEGLHFYNRSQSSLEEIKCQSLLAKDLGYFDEKAYDEVDKLSIECGKTLNGWINSQKILLKNRTASRF